MAGKDSTYTTLNIRFARVTREAARNYLKAQKEILGRHLSFTQLVNDCLIDRLERDGFLPKIMIDDDPEPPPDVRVPSSEPEAPEDVPWDTT